MTPHLGFSAELFSLVCGHVYISNCYQRVIVINVVRIDTRAQDTSVYLLIGMIYIYLQTSWVFITRPGKQVLPV